MTAHFPETGRHGGRGIIRRERQNMAGSCLCSDQDWRLVMGVDTKVCGVGLRSLDRALWQFERWRRVPCT
jgi:hypothetical protein